MTVHKADVKVGSTYAVKISGRIAPVTIEKRRVEEGDFRKAKRVTWTGLNLSTGKVVHIRSAAKLRYELVRGLVPYSNMKREGWVRKDSPPEVAIRGHLFELVQCDSAKVPDGVFYAKRVDGELVPTGMNDPVAMIVRWWTDEELVAVGCGEDADRCQEFEDESGRWRRV